MSLPRVPTHCPLATAAADPPDEPPGTRSRSHGFLVTCTNEDFGNVCTWLLRASLNSSAISCACKAHLRVKKWAVAA